MLPPTFLAHPLRSGKTTLLRALAGQLRERADLQVWTVAAVWAGGPALHGCPIADLLAAVGTAKGAASPALHWMPV